MLPISPACRLETPPAEQRWLVEELWAEQAVGIIGGEPKCCKSFMALSLGVAVASGKPCLGRFAVPTTGRVLLYPAEDALSTVRRRLDGICAVQDIDFQRLPFWVITAPRFQLDVQTDRERLRETIEKLKPKLLILDPFVRLHSVDENASGEVAKLLQHLRHLQRTYQLAVALVHHAKKGASLKRPGQAPARFFRISRLGRFESLPHSFRWQLRHSPDGRAPRRAVVRSPPALPRIRRRSRPSSDRSRITAPAEANSFVCRTAATSTSRFVSSALRIRILRQRAGLRHETVSQAIAALANRGAIEMTDLGYRLVNPKAS